MAENPPRKPKGPPVKPIAPQRYEEEWHATGLIIKVDSSTTDENRIECHDYIRGKNGEKISIIPKLVWDSKDERYHYQIEFEELVRHDRSQEDGLWDESNDYQLEMEQYEKDLKRYEKDLARYQEKLKEYQTKLSAWQQEKFGEQLAEIQQKVEE